MFLTNILQKLSRKPKPASSIWKDSRYVINYAFTADGVDYYCFDDLINKPYERALTAIDFYSELSMNVDLEYLKLHVKAIREVLQGSAKINVFEINKLNEQMNERISMIRSPNLIYKLASVVYFDKNENPTTYDFKYNQAKIKAWKKAFPDGSFFLQTPIQVLVPFLKESETNLKNYQQVWDQIETLHLENLLSPLSAKEGNSAKAKAAAL